MLIYVILMYAVFASTFTFGKAVLAYADPIFLVGIRLTIGGLLLIIGQYILDRSKVFIRFFDLLIFIQLMIFMAYISFVAEYWALQFMSSAKACLIFNLSPFISAILAFIFLRDRLTKIQFFSLIGGFVSFLPILMQQAPEEIHHFPTIGFISIPEIVLIIAMIAGSYGWIVMKKATTKGYSILMANGIGMFGGGLLSLIHSFLQEGWPSLKIVADHHSPWILSLLQNLGITNLPLFFCIFYTTLLLIASNIIGFNMYSWLLHYYSITFMSFAGFITPVFAAFFGWLLLGETVQWQFWITMTGVFISLSLFYKDELKNN